MKLIHVTAVSKRGKQLEHDHGSFWNIVGEPRSMQCFDGAEGIRIRTVDGCEYERNIKAVGDKNFFWIEMYDE